ncbi:MAG: ThiF family adenylyltransferase [Chloroflexota bacterium]
MSWDRVERLIGSQNLARLRRKRVAVAGLGSGGSFVATSLAMSGVGSFVLIDDDTLEKANIVRHMADARDIGRPKAEVVADLIRQRNPDAAVEVRVGRLEQNLDALDNVDLLIAAVDGEGSKYVLNEACLKRNLPAVYAGVYERGEGGDVVVVHPYDGPCYACWAAELREGLTFARPDEDVELDYGMIGPDGTLEAEPGLWLHVVRVASVQADMALNELLAGTDAFKEMPANTVILANTSIEIIDGQTSLPYTAVWVNIERDPNCLVCGEPMRQRAALEDREDAEEFSLEDLVESSGIVLEDESGDDRRE